MVYDSSSSYPASTKTTSSSQGIGDNSGSSGAGAGELPNKRAPIMNSTSFPRWEHDHQQQLRMIEQQQLSLHQQQVAMQASSDDAGGRNMMIGTMDPCGIGSGGPADPMGQDVLEPIVPIPPISLYSSGRTKPRHASQQRRASAPGFYAPAGVHHQPSFPAAQGPQYHGHQYKHRPYPRQHSLPFAKDISAMGRQGGGASSSSINSNSLPYSRLPPRRSESVPSRSSMIVSSRTVSNDNGCSPSDMAFNKNMSPMRHGPSSMIVQDSASHYQAHSPATMSSPRRSDCANPGMDVKLSSSPGMMSNPSSYVASSAATMSSSMSSSFSQQPQEEGPRGMRPRPPGLKSFPTKLHQILDYEEYRDCISWMPHGRSWRILKSKLFETNVLPKHFRSARYASFMRQVNGWGFRRITEGQDLNAYFHPCFVKGMPELCEDMRRPQKGQNPLEWAEEYPNKNPDFYKIHAMAPLPSTKHDPSVPCSPQRETTNEVVMSEENDVNLVSERSESDFESDLPESRKKTGSEKDQLPFKSQEERDDHADDKDSDGKDSDRSPHLSPFSQSLFMGDIDDATVTSWGDEDFSVVPRDEEHFERENFANGVFAPPHKIELALRDGAMDNSSDDVDTSLDAAIPANTTNSPEPEPEQSSSSPVGESSEGAPQYQHVIAPTLSEMTDESSCSSNFNNNNNNNTAEKKNKLSKADLKYLAYQNKLLLRQTRLMQTQRQPRPDQRKRKSPSPTNNEASSSSPTNEASSS